MATVMMNLPFGLREIAPGCIFKLVSVHPPQQTPEIAESSCPRHM